MLKEKFDGAHEVKQKRKNGRRMLLPKYHRFKPHGDIDLVYLVTSPDYCELDVKRGSLGTKGRECDPVCSNHSSNSNSYVGNPSSKSFGTILAVVLVVRDSFVNLNFSQVAEI